VDKKDDLYSPDEIQRRFEAVVKSALNTPPKHRPDKRAGSKPQSELKVGAKPKGKASKTVRAPKPTQRS
jgi:hypothetical protein